HDRIEALSLSDDIAVMRAGQIVEIGTPKSIYFDSEQQFVADFIGRANLIPGKIASAENAGAVIDTPMGPMTCHKEVASPSGKAVTVCVRPEFIQVVQGDQGKGQNIFRGRVESLVFVGDAYEGEIRVGETRLITRIEPTASVKEGDDILLHIDPGQCSVLLR
ncbi:MAG TPA: TOBE domain-containing protein, partial [Desulfatiglandales bacterium]|nr:TOBE domain-containing protein [Desulfatiglandales bacterium]